MDTRIVSGSAALTFVCRGGLRVFSFLEKYLECIIIVTDLYVYESVCLF